MKFSENWLWSWVHPPVDDHSVADTLTMSGLEVEARERSAPNFNRVVVARIMEIAQHPNADRLKVCKVDAGADELLQIVCGAPNVSVDALVPCALVGAQVGELQIKQSVLRGIDSHGMLCSAQELGLSADASGLLLFPNDASIGMDVAKYLDLNDTLTTLKLTPNRGDCLSMAGLAREVSALTGGSANAPAWTDVTPTLTVSRDVRIQNASACGLYCGRVIKLARTGAATPTWMKSRLERSGLRPISAVVDVTNYVMLELGQPLHAFDNDKLSGDIVIRFAGDGETLRLLNQQEVNLTADMVVIADSSGPIALGGIMGGDDSSVTDATHSIFLEAAFFPPGSVTGRPRRLGLTSDAAYRFERGVDFGNTRRAIERATQLIIDICGGEAGSVTQAQTSLPARDPVLVRPPRVHRILGIEIDSDVATRILVSLRCVCRIVDQGILVTPPSHRFDLTIEADFIEEIARVYGYDNIPATRQVSSAALLPQPQGKRSVANIARHLVSRDYQEVLTYSFVNADWERDFSPGQHPIPVQNPIAAQMSVMRTTLIGGLIETLRFNLNRKQERVRIFEIGSCFLPKAIPDDRDIAIQRQRIAGISYGNRYEEQWGERARLVDYFDIKADLEAVFHDAKIEFRKFDTRILHPGRSAAVYLAGQPVGYLGELHPVLGQKYELTSAPLVFELDLEPLLPIAVAHHRDISKFPTVRRDIAVVVDENIPAKVLIDSLYAAAPPSVQEIELFDQYHGKNLANGKKSLAFRIVMSDTEKTLTEEEIEKIDQSLKHTLVSLHQAQLRS